MELAEKRYAQWLAQQGLEPELRQELDAMHSDAEKVTDAFYRDLEFGTAGLRGVLGAGTNRMNIYVIRRATQAVAQYLNETELPKTVAIGHDSRIKSDVFAREAAAVFAANGITAYLYPRLEPVPALSFAVRHLHCGLGVCVTASHNPAEYNGYKVYGSDGCQMTPEAAKRVVALLERMDYFTSAKTTDFDAALAAGSIRYIPDEVLDAFVDAVYAQRVGSGEGIENLKLVYTPLNGAGLECVKKLTQKLGIRNMTIVKEQEHPDGHFPTCPYPNPEIREALECGLKLCREVKPDLLLATDPDADRVGIAVPDGDDYALFSGNEVGAMLLEYICQQRTEKGTMPKNPIAVKTIVTTDIVNAIAKEYGVTRVSINPQTLNDDILRGIGRKHSSDDFFRAYYQARKSGIPAINTDIIAGLPGDSFSSFSKTVDQIAELHPENITVHTFFVKKASDILHSGVNVTSRNSLEAVKCVHVTIRLRRLFVLCR